MLSACCQLAVRSYSQGVCFYSMFAYSRRLDCYNCILDTLKFLLFTSYTNVTSPSVPNKPGPPTQKTQAVLTADEAEHHVSWGYVTAACWHMTTLAIDLISSWILHDGFLSFFSSYYCKMSKAFTSSKYCSCKMLSKCLEVTHSE